MYVDVIMSPPGLKYVIGFPAAAVRMNGGMAYGVVLA